MYNPRLADGVDALDAETEKGIKDAVGRAAAIAGEIEEIEASPMRQALKIKGVACPLCGNMDLAVFPRLRKMQCGSCLASNDIEKVERRYVR